VDVLWGNENLSNTFSYEKIKQTAIIGLQDSDSVAGTLSVNKNAIGRGYKVLVDDRNLYKKNHEDFPNFSIDFISKEGKAYPSNSKVIKTSHPFWNIQFGIGTTKIDRISSNTLVVLPFSLVHKNANCVHSGLAIFSISKVNTISNILFEIASETCAYYKFDFVGLYPASFSKSDIKSNQDIYNRRTKAIKGMTKPIEDLYSKFSLNNNSFLNSNYVNTSNVSLFGVIDGNNHYVSNCNTRLGEFPFCDQLLLPSYSLAKSIAGSLTLSLIENEFGPIENLLVNDLVEECSQRKWKGVSLNDLSDMATGQYINATHDRDESGASSTQFIFNLLTHKDKLNKACKAFPRKTKPGRKFVYHTSDTYILGTAMNNFLMLNTNYDDYFSDFLIPFFKDYDFSQASESVLRTEDKINQPYTGWGMFFLRDDLQLISKIMHKAMIDKTSSFSFLQEALNPNKDNSLVAIPSVSIYYNNGFWSRRFDKSAFNCKEDVWIPFMSGFGGITFAFFPNGMTYYYFSDGYDYAWESAVFSSNAIKPFC
jgi:hypothetical protein